MDSIFFSFDRPIALKTPHPPVNWSNPVHRPASDPEPAGLPLRILTARAR